MNYYENREARAVVTSARKHVVPIQYTVCLRWISAHIRNTHVSSCRKTHDIIIMCAYAVINVNGFSGNRNGFEKNINTIYYDVLAIVALWPFEAVGRIWSVQVVRETKSGAHKCFLTQVTTISVGRFFYSGIIFPHIFLLLKKK